MTNRAISVVASIMLLAFAGCVGTAQLATPSGNPEVTIPGTTKKAVSGALVNHMINKGWEVKSVDDFRLVFKKRLDSVGAMMFFGSNFNAFPEGRATYTIVEGNDGVRVIGAAEIVTNPGSGFEQVTPDRRSDDLNDMQVALNGLRGELTGAGQAAAGAVQPAIAPNK